MYRTLAEAPASYPACCKLLMKSGYNIINQSLGKCWKLLEPPLNFSGILSLPIASICG